MGLIEPEKRSMGILEEQDGPRTRPAAAERSWPFQGDAPAEEKPRDTGILFELASDEARADVVSPRTLADEAAVRNEPRLPGTPVEDVRALVDEIGPDERETIDWMDAMSAAPEERREIPAGYNFPVARPLAMDKETLSGETDRVHALESGRTDETRGTFPQMSKKEGPSPLSELKLTAEEITRLDDLGLYWGVAKEYNLGDMGVHDPKEVERLTRLHRRVRNYGRVMARMRDFMDAWVANGMPVADNAQLEDFVKRIGSRCAAEGAFPREKSDLDKGREIIRRAWWILRGDIENAIAMTTRIDLVRFSDLAHRLGSEGLNMPGIKGYTFCPEAVETLPPQTAIALLIHEPMHDFGAYFLFHEAWGEWKTNHELIGWNVAPDWEEAVMAFVGHVAGVMMRTPIDDPPQAGSRTRWESALRQSGL